MARFALLEFLLTAFVLYIIYRLVIFIIKKSKEGMDNVEKKGKPNGKGN